jgi:Mg/Co/Ni transporter MgtE
MRRLTIVAASLVLFACEAEKKQEPPPAPAPAPAAVAKTKTMDDHADRAIAIMSTLADLMHEHKHDCDRMAVALETFHAEHKDELAEIGRAGEKMTPEERQKIQARFASEMRVLGAKMSPAAAACKDNWKVQETLLKIGTLR